MGWWGCIIKVFSAHAEVVPISMMEVSMSLRILRARGGSSGGGLVCIMKGVYSPRTRR